MAQPAPHKWGLYETIKETDICPECLEDPPNITHHFSSGDVVCLSCGLVLGGNIIDTRSEWRTFADGDGKKADPNRVGDAANPLLFGEGLETRIGGDTAASISLSRAQMLASKTADDKGNTKLREGFAVIDSFCASGKLNSMVVEASKHWFSLAIKGGWFNSYPMDIYIGFIFWGCKTGQHARTAGELSSLGGGQYSKKTISKAATRINNKFMQMGVDMMLRSADFGSSSSKSDSTPRLGSSSVTTATSLIPRFCQTVGDIPVWAETIACGISEALRDTMALDSRSASNVATCSIYLMLHLVELPRHWDNVYPVSGLGKGAPFLPRYSTSIYTNHPQVP